MLRWRSCTSAPRSAPAIRAWCPDPQTPGTSGTICPVELVFVRPFARGHIMREIAEARVGKHESVLVLTATAPGSPMRRPMSVLAGNLVWPSALVAFQANASALPNWSRVDLILLPNANSHARPIPPCRVRVSHSWCDCPRAREPGESIPIQLSPRIPRARDAALVSAGIELGTGLA